MSVLYRTMTHLHNRFSISVVVRVISSTQPMCYKNVTKKKTFLNHDNDRDSFRSCFGQTALLHTHQRQTIDLPVLKSPSQFHNCFSQQFKRSYSNVPNSTVEGVSDSVVSEATMSSASMLSDVNTTNIMTQLAEPTLASQGLGSYWPPGLVQHALQYFHVDLGLPWWGSIVLLTGIIRFCMLPIYIKARKNAIVMHNSMPESQKLQQEMLAAAKEGDIRRTQEIQSKLMGHMKIQSRAMMVPMMQAPVFIAMFWGLRPMANLPIESMKTGGILWFPDLTVMEPFYGLPLLTVLTLLGVLQVGADVDMSQQPHGKTIMKVMQGATLLMLPIMSNFPTAMLVYWFTSNTITLIQVAIFKIPGVQKALDFPEKIPHVIDITPRKGILDGYREFMNNEQRKQAVTMSEIKRLDALAKQKAEIQRLKERASYVEKLTSLQQERQNQKKGLEEHLKNSHNNDEQKRV